MNDETCSVPGKADADIAAALAALAHPARLSILRALSSKGCCCCKDVVAELPLAQSTVSQHLKIMAEAGLVTFRRDANRSSYALNHERLRTVAQIVGGIVEQCCPPRDCPHKE